MPNYSDFDIGGIHPFESQELRHARKRVLEARLQGSDKPKYNVRDHVKVQGPQETRPRYIIYHVDRLFKVKNTEGNAPELWVTVETAAEKKLDTCPDPKWAYRVAYRRDKTGLRARRADATLRLMYPNEIGKIIEWHSLDCDGSHWIPEEKLSLDRAHAPIDTLPSQFFFELKDGKVKGLSRAEAIKFL